MKKHFVTFSLFLVIVTGSYSQELPLILNKQGTFEIHGNMDETMPGSGFTKADITANLQKITELVNIMRKNPVLSNPVGFDGRARIYPGNRKDAEHLGVPSRISFEFAAWYRKKDGKEVRGFIEPPEWSLHINKIVPAGYQFSSDRFSDNPDFFTVPAKKETISPGVDVYDGECFVLYNPDQPGYWLPVTVKEAFDVAYAELKRNSNEVQWDIMKKMLDEEWAAIPQEDWNKHATMSGMISKVGTREGSPKIMKVNPAYWDKSKPKSDIQFIYFRMITNKEFLEQQTKEYLKNNSISYHCARFEESLDTGMAISIQKIIGK